MKTIFNFKTGFPAAHTGTSTLADLEVGQRARISGMELDTDDTHRMLVLGFAEGTEVCIDRIAPGGKLRVCEVEGNQVALRHDAAARIRVTRIQ